MEENISQQSERLIMSERKVNSFNSQASQIYEIRVRAYLDSCMGDWLGDFTIRHPTDAETILTGFLADQSALFGMLLRLHNLGIPLISVNLLPLHSDSIQTGEGKPEVPEVPRNQERREGVRCPHD
jgi:hypothetical protein